MSLQAAKDFLVKVSTDEPAAQKAREAHEASLVAVARELGYDVTAEDLREAMSEIALLDDLPADDTDEVVGGRQALFSRQAFFTGRDSIASF